jgi:hypothetical protein
MLTMDLYHTYSDSVLCYSDITPPPQHLYSDLNFPKIFNSHSLYTHLLGFAHARLSPYGRYLVIKLSYESFK